MIDKFSLKKKQSRPFLISCNFSNAGALNVQPPYNDTRLHMHNESNPFIVKTHHSTHINSKLNETCTHN